MSKASKLTKYSVVPATDKFRDTTAEYYKELAAGRADGKDFERYIYGQYGAKSYQKDDRDKTEEVDQEQRNKIEHEVKRYVAAQEGRQ